MYKFLILYLLISLTYAVPPKERYDKATIDDVGVNVVSPNKIEQTPLSNNDANKPLIDTTIKNEAGINGNVPEVTIVQKPGHTGPTFTRFIEDIFQIPITILQAVSNLITNPFRANRKSPETTVTTY